MNRLNPNAPSFFPTGLRASAAAFTPKALPTQKPNSSLVSEFESLLASPPPTTVAAIQSAKNALISKLKKQMQMQQSQNEFASLSKEIESVRRNGKSRKARRMRRKTRKARKANRK
jgi:hypothetical protein